MFWTTELFVTVPEVFILDFKTAEPAVNYGNGLFNVVKDSDYKYRALFKLFRRSFLAFSNIVFMICYVRTLETEDRQFYEQRKKEDAELDQRPRVLKIPKKTISKWL